jgi:glutathione synthase
MRIGFVVNGVRTQRATYSTLLVAFEAARRGHDVHFVGIDGLSLTDDGRVLGQAARPIAIGAPGPSRHGDARAYCQALVAPDCPIAEVVLSDFDVVFLRNNPNVGPAAAAGDRENPALGFGRRLKRDGVMVLNDPDALARAASKMYLAGFPDEIRPRTLISRNLEQIHEFIRALDGPSIIKPLHGFGGHNVFYLRRGQVTNLHQMIGAVREGGHVIVQEYLPAVARGDKRVLLLRGEPLRVGGRVAAYKRMRPKDDIRNNMHVGGQRKKCSFSPAEERICALLTPRLRADGLYLVGVDLVGDKVLEINVLAPGGIHNINELYGVSVGAAIVDDLERTTKARAHH